MQPLCTEVVEKAFSSCEAHENISVDANQSAQCLGQTVGAPIFAVVPPKLVTVADLTMRALRLGAAMPERLIHTFTRSSIAPDMNSLSYLRAHRVKLLLYCTEILSDIPPNVFSKQVVARLHKMEKFTSPCEDPLVMMDIEQTKFENWIQCWTEMWQESGRRASDA